MTGNIEVPDEKKPILLPCIICGSIPTHYMDEWGSIIKCSNDLCQLSKTTISIHTNIEFWNLLSSIRLVKNQVCDTLHSERNQWQLISTKNEKNDYIIQLLEALFYEIMEEMSSPRVDFLSLKNLLSQTLKTIDTIKKI